MFTRIKTGLSLARSSWRVLMNDKKLLVFPMLSGFLSLLVIASFGFPLFRLFQEGHLFDEQHHLRPWVYPIAFAAYFSVYFVIIFCNSAMITCVILKLDGKEATLGDGLRGALSRRRQILAWAIVSACVGVILMAIESHKRGGELIARLLGAAWSIMTYFALPVLVVQNVGPIQAIKGSASLLRKTWGEALVGRTGLGLFSLLLAVPVGILYVAAYYLWHQNHSMGLIAFGVAGLATLLYLAMTSAMNTVFLTALYEYAAFNRTPKEFDTQTLAVAFTPKTHK